MKTKLDKFYTVPAIAQKCIDTVGEKYPWNNWDLVVEPSAGNGSFLLKIPTKKRIGLDILPEHPDIIKRNFFDYRPPEGKVLVIGNPPFGRVSSLAIQFFNWAAEWARTIAFIVPRTFRRISVQNKLNLNFQLVLDEDIPLNPPSFQPKMMAKCCFQIWERSQEPRKKIILPTTHPDWEFLGFGPKDAQNQPTPPQGAHFAIRAYGGRCGEIVGEGLEQLRPKNWHWIRSNFNV